jgi:hypothetical protein
MKTAVENLFELIEEIPVNSPEASDFYQEVLRLKDQAKEMEEAHISKAFFEGRLTEIGSNVLFDMQPLIDTYYDYYNETFGKTIVTEYRDGSIDVETFE